MHQTARNHQRPAAPAIQKLAAASTMEGADRKSASASNGGQPSIDADHLLLRVGQLVSWDQHLTNESKGAQGPKERSPDFIESVKTLGGELRAAFEAAKSGDIEAIKVVVAVANFEAVGLLAKISPEAREVAFSLYQSGDDVFKRELVRFCELHLPERKLPASPGPSGATPLAVPAKPESSPTPAPDFLHAADMVYLAGLSARELKGPENQATPPSSFELRLTEWLGKHEALRPDRPAAPSAGGVVATTDPQAAWKEIFAHNRVVDAAELNGALETLAPRRGFVRLNPLSGNEPGKLQKVPQDQQQTRELVSAMTAACTAQAKPVVAALHAQQHWILLIAVPRPAAAGGPPAAASNPEFIVFDSNVAESDPQSAVGGRLLKFLQDAGQAASPVFGNLQGEGLAEHGCGPLCLSAAERAFGADPSKESPATHEGVVSNLQKFVRSFSKHKESEPVAAERLLRVSRAKLMAGGISRADMAIARSAAPSQGVSRPDAKAIASAPASAVSEIALQSRSSAVASSAVAANSQSAGALVRAAGDAIKLLPEGVFDTAASAVDEETRLLADALTTARRELPPEPRSGFLSSIKQGAESLSDSFIPESRANRAKQAQREVERNRVEGIKSRITALEALRAQNGRRRELASAADKALRRWDQVIDPANPLRLAPSDQASRSATFEREFKDAHASLLAETQAYRELRQQTPGLAPLPEPDSKGAAVGKFRLAAGRR